MNNHIRQVRSFVTRLNPAEAEVCFTVIPEQLTSTTQVVGRLLGPYCPYATTVEVAYPLREHSREYASTGQMRLIMRVAVPEPNLWDPPSPFLYRALLELWQSGQRCDQTEVTHAFHAVQLGPQGVRVNGRPLLLRGVSRSPRLEEECRALHGQNINLLLAPVTADNTSLWDLADRFGFLAIGRLADKSALHHAASLGTHLCCLGWLLAPELLEQESSRICAQTLPDPNRGHYLGVELKRAPTALPEEISFVACAEELLPALTGVFLPKLMLREGRAGGENLATDPGALGVLGWVAE